MGRIRSTGPVGPVGRNRPSRGGTASPWPGPVEQGGRGVSRVTGPAALAEQGEQQVLGGGPVPGVAGERGPDDRREIRRHGPQVRLTRQDLLRHLQVGAVAVGVTAGGRVTDQQSPGEDVDRRAERGALHLLGRHPADRAEDQTRLGAALCHVERAGDPEIDDPGAGVRQHDVARFEIPVDDAGPVDGGERGRHADRHALQCRQRQRTGLGDGLIKPDAVDVLRDQIRTTRVGIGIEDLGGAEGRDPPSGRHLVPETCPELRVGGEVRPDHLDRNELLGCVLGEEHRSHPTRAQPTDDLVNTDRGRIIGMRRLGRISATRRNPTRRSFRHCSPARVIPPAAAQVPFRPGSRHRCRNCLPVQGDEPIITPQSVVAQSLRASATARKSR